MEGERLLVYSLNDWRAADIGVRGEWGRPVLGIVLTDCLVWLFLEIHREVGSLGPAGDFSAGAEKVSGPFGRVVLRSKVIHS